MDRTGDQGAPIVPDLRTIAEAVVLLLPSIKSNHPFSLSGVEGPQLRHLTLMVDNRAEGVLSVGPDRVLDFDDACNRLGRELFNTVRAEAMESGGFMFINSGHPPFSSMVPFFVRAPNSSVF